jgi:hypothetical protein
MEHGGRLRDYLSLLLKNDNVFKIQRVVKGMY